MHGTSKDIAERLSPSKYGLITASPNLKKGKKVMSFNDHTSPIEIDRIEAIRASKERRRFGLEKKLPDIKTKQVEFLATPEL